MESQPQNPEFRIIPENFHPCPHAPLLCFILANCTLIDDCIYAISALFYLGKDI